MDGQELANLKEISKEKENRTIRERIQTVVLSCEGWMDSEIAEALGYSVPWVKKWIARFRKGGIEGLRDLPRPGAPKLLNDDQIEELARRLKSGPSPQDILSRYRIKDLIELVKEWFGVEYSEGGMYGLVKRIGFSYIKPRPEHPKKDPGEAKKWKKKVLKFLQKMRQKLGPNIELQTMYEDESRFGQKGMLSRIWAPRGTRPRMTRQNGFKSAYFVGAVNPLTGDNYSLIFDGLDTQVMNVFLKGVSDSIRPNVHIVMFVDGARWHSSEELEVPSNITLYHLPPYSPELNPIEIVWSYLKSNFLSGRVFKDMAEIFDFGVKAWNQLTQETVQKICASGLIVA